ncbi:MAG TPA: RDD family protein [Pseudomonadota bacterium]|nr:RDD family protein [Deltaproteobacteria bacterium]HPH29811.1 RDD family protein [Pseudomonadota bacterium]
MALAASTAIQDPSLSATTPRTAYRAAGFFRRAAAAVIDILLIFPVLAVLGILLCVVLGQPIPRLAELSPDLLLASLLDGNLAGEALLVLGTIITLLYFFIFHATRGQTPGKQALGLLVVDVYGEKPGLAKSLFRTVGYALSALPFSLGLLWIGFDREKRALHDWVAGTYVVLAQ